jgi:hypothetical protein
LDKNDWSILCGNNKPRTSIGLNDIFSEERWAELRQMNSNTNDRIHDGIISTLKGGKRFIILSEYNENSVKMLKEIASTCDLVFSVDDLIVKDENDVSDTSTP